MQQTSPLIAGQLTLRNARTLTQTDNRAIADSSETDERENDEYDSDAIDSGGDDSSDVILALICDSDEEDAVRSQMLHAQGELSLGDPKLTSLSFDLCYLINCSL